jgi:predicted transcriptional regulator of viral defense system
MLEITTKENSIEIAVRLYDNNAYGTTFGKGMYRRALFNGTIDAKSPTAKYLVDCFNYQDWCNQASTDEQMAVLAAVEADDKKLYSWIKHYDSTSRVKRLVSGCMTIDVDSLDMDILICDPAVGIEDRWSISARPCKTRGKNQNSPQILGTNADLANW